ncbi:hypothetical protein CTI12_AA597560 [Artemisia annua]|uniref:PB1-like domain-containing protein n=1 Tax=Artemisia annua TaxID=35608 RepID=A0A2U1KIS2_ARTAN|nr:hypothetical protein CTI12_AA597560 [Artemisia annua]
MFTLQIHHNGEFTSPPGRRYLFGDIDWFDRVYYDIFSMDLLGEMLEDLGYTDRTLVFTHFRIPGESLDDGLLPLMSDKDARRLVKYVPRFRELELYIETGVSLRMMTKGKGVVIEEVVDHDINDAVGKDLDVETGNSGKLLLLEWHKTSQPEKAGPVYDTNSDNDFPPTFCAEKMIANHTKRLIDEFQLRRLLEEIDQEFMVENSSDDSLESTDVLDFDDAYYDDTSDVDVPEPEEPQEISDMFVEIDQALDELDAVVAAEEVTEMYAFLRNQLVSVWFHLWSLVKKHYMYAEVVGDEGFISAINGDVITDKVVAKQGDVPDEVLAKNGVGQDRMLAEEKFENQGRLIKRRRLMADKKTMDDAK